MAVRTYLDSNVLILAHNNMGAVGSVARTIIGEANREFVSSVFVRLETLPLTHYFNRQREEAFYTRFFNTVIEWGDTLVTAAFTLAFNFCERSGMAAIDAMHLALATLLRADEFITAERPTKPMFRITSPSMRIISIRP